nr:MAG TPA: hypothetical protein [Caudoviricetes sp.]
MCSITLFAILTLPFHLKFRGCFHPLLIFRLTYKNPELKSCYIFISLFAF